MKKQPVIARSKWWSNVQLYGTGNLWSNVPKVANEGTKGCDESSMKHLKKDTKRKEKTVFNEANI